MARKVRSGERPFGRRAGRRGGGQAGAVAVAAGLLLMLLSALPAAACSCKVLTTSEYAARAGLVAEVVVEARTPKASGSSAAEVVYTMRALRVFKGPAAASYRVSSAANGTRPALRPIRRSPALATQPAAVGVRAPRAWPPGLRFWRAARPCGYTDAVRAGESA